jgi:hypothetical protein
MKTRRNIGLIAAFLAASALFLVLEHVTHVEFFLHAAAIPLEVLVAAFIVERIIERREIQAKRRRLMYIKSHMFRSEMRGLFVAVFAALKSPAVDFPAIRRAGLDALRRWRREADAPAFGPEDAEEAAVTEYIKAEGVWRSFLERAIAFNFEEIFHAMIFILHFASDVKAFRERHPGASFVREAAARPDLRAKMDKVLGDGVRSFLDYAIELKTKEPAMFEEVLADYELAAGRRDAGAPPASRPV